MDRVSAVYEHKSTGLVLLGLGVVTLIIGLVLHWPLHAGGSADLERLGSTLAVIACTRISHQVTGGYVRTANRYRRVANNRTALAALPRREHTDR